MFLSSTLCNHFGVEAEIESYSGKEKKGAACLQYKMAAMYNFDHIWCGHFAVQDGADGCVFDDHIRCDCLQCMMAAIYTSLPNERLELETVVAGKQYQKCSRKYWV